MTISDLLFTFLALHPSSILHLKDFQGTPLLSESDQGKDTPAGALPEPNGWHHKGSWKRICVFVCVCVWFALLSFVVYFLKYESC